LFKTKIYNMIRRC